MSEWNYIIAAYASTWAVILGYAVYLFLRQRNASQRIIRMRQTR